jgi:phenylacetate-CoA ligase
LNILIISREQPPQKFGIAGNVMEDMWNPVLESMPLSDLRKLQLYKFKRIFTYAYNKSPFYRTKFDAAGIKPEDIRTLDDIRRIPFTTKEEMRKAQEGKEPFPFGELLTVPVGEVTEYHQTTGTTGLPVRYADTWSDWDWFSENWAYCMYSRGFNNADVVYIPFPYHLFIAFWGGHYGSEKVGAMVIPGGSTSTEERIHEMADLRCTTIMCTPTYALKLAETARKIGIDPVKDIPVNKIFCAGEPGASIPATKKRIEEAWGAKVYDHLGATEAPLWAFECKEQNGLHINEAMDLVEILNPETHEPAAPGETGTVVVTTLDRYAMPSIRFDLKDIVRLSAGNASCKCGRTWRMIEGGILGRRDDISKVRGVLFSPSSVEEAVRRIPELGNEYELVVDNRDNYDEILVKVEIISEYGGSPAEIKEKLVRELRNTTQLRCDVEFCEYGSLPRYEVKARRFKDLRKKHN